MHYLELGWGGSAETIVVAVLTVGERLGWVSSIWLVPTSFLSLSLW